MAIVRKTQIDFQKLIERSDSARETLAEARVELKNKFNVAAQVKEAVTSDPAKIAGGSLIAGYVLKKLLFRKPKRSDPPREHRISHLKKERGLLLGLLALITALAKPAAKMYAAKLVKQYLRNRFVSGSLSRPVRSRF